MVGERIGISAIRAEFDGMKNLRVAACLLVAFWPVLGHFGPAVAQSAPASALPRTIGRLTARFVRGGLLLDLDSIPLLKGGVVQVFSANYQEGYYGSGDNPPTATVETLPDGGYAYTAVFTYRSERGAFQATQRIEIHPGETLAFSIHACWEGAEPALLEWNPVRLWATPLLGATFTAETGTAGSVNGRIGLKPLASAYPANRLTPPWKRLELHLPALGALTFVASEATDGRVLLDTRIDPNLQNDRVFWLGY